MNKTIIVYNAKTSLFTTEIEIEKNKANKNEKKHKILKQNKMKTENKKIVKTNSKY